MSLFVRIFRVAAYLFGAVGVTLVLFWFWLAIGVHLTGALRIAAQIVVIAAALITLIPLSRGRALLLWATVAAGIILAQIWWAFVPASNNRDWAPELAHGVTGDIAPGQVTLHNLRNFNWITPETGTPSWETAVVDPDTITSVDLLSSVWDSPLIAHTLLSFGFADGRHVVFSSEIRRQKGEVFSSLGGFVRQFELILIAADERDVVYLRTDIRGERVSLFPLTISPEARKKLFLGFVNFGNELAAEPRWYNTLTENCTTMPFRLVRELGGTIPFDWRILASGKLQGYLHDQGLLRPELPLAQIETLALLPRFGPLPADGVTYSRDIRRAWAD